MEILTFLFGVLGSVGFWILYFVVSSFAIACLLRWRNDHSRAYVVITTGRSVKDVASSTPGDTGCFKWVPKRGNPPATIEDKLAVLWILFIWYLVWPLWVLGILVYHLFKLMVFILSGGMFVWMRKLLQVVPKVEIITSKEE